MKSRSKLYQGGVLWIAENDETAETDTAKMADLISVMLLADMFGLTPKQVAGDVIEWRWGK